jgi:hypothetical protein
MKARDSEVIGIKDSLNLICSADPEYDGNKVLQNAGILL